MSTTIVERIVSPKERLYLAQQLLTYGQNEAALIPVCAPRCIAFLRYDDLSSLISRCLPVVIGDKTVPPLCSQDGQFTAGL